MQPNDKWRHCALWGLPSLLCLSLFCLQVFLQAAVRADERDSTASALQVPAVQRAALQLARRTITQYLNHKTTPSIPADLPPILKRRFGVFVTIEKHGQIAPRGCRGTLQPAYANLADEIIHNAIAACTRDQTQPPLRLDELAHCRISLTVILRTQPLQSIAQHNPDDNGLIAQNDNHIGIVLPYEGHDALTQLHWAKRKAGLSDTAQVHLLELFAVRCRE